MNCRTTRVFVAVTLVLACRSRLAGAQWKLAVTPYFASYFPVARLVDSAGFKEQQANAPMVGARLTYWVSRTIALDAGMTIGYSKIIQEAEGTLLTGSVSNKQNGRLTFSSARVLFMPLRSNFYGIVGPTWITRRGDAWPKSAYPGRDNAGVVLGTGVRSEVTPHLSLWVDVEANLYHADFDGGGTAGRYYHRTLQKDVLVRIGAPIPLLTR